MSFNEVRIQKYFSQLVQHVPEISVSVMDPGWKSQGGGSWGEVPGGRSQGFQNLPFLLVWHQNSHYNKIANYKSIWRISNPQILKYFSAHLSYSLEKIFCFPKQSLHTALSKTPGSHPKCLWGNLILYQGTWTYTSCSYICQSLVPFAKLSKIVRRWMLITSRGQ